MRLSGGAATSFPLSLSIIAKDDLNGCLELRVSPSQVRSMSRPQTATILPSKSVTGQDYVVSLNTELFS